MTENEPTQSNFNCPNPRPKRMALCSSFWQRITLGGESVKKKTLRCPGHTIQIGSHTFRGLRETIVANHKPPSRLCRNEEGLLSAKIAVEVL